MNVPFLDLKATYLELKNEIDAALSRVLHSGWYILGSEVESFEAEFANFCGAQHCVGVANGLDALKLALLALEVGPGDEVIVPSNTYIATWLAVSEVGAKPVAVEPDPMTHNLDPARIGTAITSKTKVILPVHLYGQPADLKPILDLARAKGVFVLEDAAQAQGAKYDGRRIGAHGDAVAWSFYPGKNLGAFGDAGAVTTNNASVAEKIRILRNYGSKTKYYNVLRGYNSRLDPMQAAVLRVKLKYLDEWNARRATVAFRYLEELAKADLILPKVSPACESAWHLFVVRSQRRGLTQNRLKERGIETLIHYPVPPHLQVAYGDLNLPKGTFPVAEQLADEVLSLPIGPHLTAPMLERVVVACLDS